MLDLSLTLMLIGMVWIFLVPIVAIIAFLLAQTFRGHRRLWLTVSLVFAVMWVPMLGNILGMWRTIWPLPTGSIRSAVNLPGYRVEFVSNSIHSDASEYFDIIRSDGKRGFVNIDGDANACRDFKQMRESSRILFVCEGDPAFSYVDTEQMELYSWFTQTTIPLKDLEYK